MPQKRSWQELVLGNLGFKILALFIALILWVAVLDRREFLISRQMSILIEHETGFSLNNDGDGTNVIVSFTGPRALLKTMDFVPEKAGVLRVRAEGLKEGFNNIVLNAERLNLDPRIRVISIRPETVKVYAERVK